MAYLVLRLINPVRTHQSPVQGSSLLLAFILLCTFNVLDAQSPQRGELRLMWYNVENLFYPGTDSLSTPDSLNNRDLLNPDAEFTTEGIRRWTWKRYRAKLTGLAKVIVAAGNWEPPDVVGLGEVEDARVLEDLINHPILKSFEYAFVHKNSQDHRGMDVACLYREEGLGLVGWSAHSPDREQAPQHRSQGSTQGNPQGNPSGTRDMLHLCFSWGKEDTLDVFMVHLVSKYGGAGATAPRRRKQAETLVQLVDSVHRRRVHSLKILTGDFNENYDGYSMEPIRKTRFGGDSIRALVLSGAKGTYKYRGRWSRIDLILMLGPPGNYQVSGSILNLPPLLKQDKTYGGLKPARTYEAYSYAGGLSDHLPILLDINRSRSTRPFSSRPEH